MWRSIFLGFILTAILILTSCNKDDKTPKLIFKFKFDSTQARLDNIGNLSTIAPGHAAQSPIFNLMSAHYIELTQDRYTPLGNGAVLFKAPEVTTVGATAIDFEQSVNAKEGDIFYSTPLKGIKAGTYEWLRVSLAYQNYDVSYYMDTTISGFPLQQDFPCTIASFIGYNTYIKNYQIKTRTIGVNANKLQGYWGAETNVSLPQYGYNQTFAFTGQAPGTTVVNPLNVTSPIPPGSCVVTGSFVPGKLTITGNETKDIVITVSLSTNNSFEWKDLNGNGKWDATKGEQVTDMGIRGMSPIVAQ